MDLSNSQPRETHRGGGGGTQRETETDWGRETDRQRERQRQIGTERQREAIKGSTPLIAAMVEAVTADNEDSPSRVKRQASSPQTFVVELLLVIDYGVYEL